MVPGHLRCLCSVILDLSSTHASGRVQLGTVLALMWLIYSSPVSSAAVTSSPGMHLI